MSNKLVENKNIVTFSSREAECLRQILEGKSRLEIAESLNLKERTVNFFLTNGKYKLDMLIGGLPVHRRSL
jgi:DNA-binding CsgD family transcriptional regulator